MYTHMQVCICTHLHNEVLLARRSDLAGHAGLDPKASGKLAELLRIAQSGPEMQSYCPRAVAQQTLVTSAVTLSPLQLWPRAAKPVSQPLLAAWQVLCLFMFE